MQPDYDKLNFYTGANYMKRSDKSGQGALAITNPNVMNEIAGVRTIDHNLGYVPQFNYFVDLLNDGMLWYGGEIVFEGTDSTSSGPGGISQIVVEGWMDTTKLSLAALDRTEFGSASGSRDCFWLIYLDYKAA